MEKVIEYLQDLRDFELHQMGMTPLLNFKGTQEDHDNFHLQNAKDYEDAIEILSGKYNVRDWMTSEVFEFETYREAKNKYENLLNLGEGYESDIQLYCVIKEHTEL